MMVEEHDPTWQKLQRLPILEPDPVRTAGVRDRCRAAFAARHSRRERTTTSERVAARVLESGLTFGLPAVYLLAMIEDLLKLYARR